MSPRLAASVFHSAAGRAEPTGPACVTIPGTATNVEPTTFAIGLRCVRCGATYPLGPLFEGCQACATPEFRSGLTPEYDYAALRAALGDGMLAEVEQPGIWRYRRLLPVMDAAHAVSLGEGSTALLLLPRLARELGLAELRVKDESRPPMARASNGSTPCA